MCLLPTTLSNMVLYAVLRHVSGEPCLFPLPLNIRSGGQFTSSTYHRARNAVVAFDLVQATCLPAGTPAFLLGTGSQAGALKRLVAEVTVDLLDPKKDRVYQNLPLSVYRGSGHFKVDLNPFWRQIPCEERTSGTVQPVILVFRMGVDNPPIQVAFMITWIGCRKTTNTRLRIKTSKTIRHPKRALQTVPAIEVASARTLGVESQRR